MFNVESGSSLDNDKKDIQPCTEFLPTLWFSAVHISPLVKGFRMRKGHRLFPLYICKHLYVCQNARDHTEIWTFASKIFHTQLAVDFKWYYLSCRRDFSPKSIIHRSVPMICLLLNFFLVFMVIILIISYYINIFVFCHWLIYFPYYKTVSIFYYSWICYHIKQL